MKMKNSLLALTEAVRLARLEIACYQDPTCGASATWTVNRLAKLLGDKAVSDAMALIAPDEDSPSIVPNEEQHRTVMSNGARHA